MPEWEITVNIDEQFVPKVTEEALIAAISAVLRHENIGNAGVAVVVTDNDYIQRLNRDFRGVDAPTDVLSFAAQEGDELDAAFAAEVDSYLGDLILAYPYAAAQAARYGYPMQTELQLLVVHGCLHLLGYDHDTDENLAEMWAAQNAILTSLGVSADLSQRMAAQ